MCLHAVDCAHDNEGVSDRACLTTLYCITDQKGDVFGHFAAVMRLCVPLAQAQAVQEAGNMPAAGRPDWPNLSPVRSA